MRKFLGLVVGAMLTTGAYSTTHLVLNNNDAGPGSLRDVIATAAANDTVYFDSSLTTGVITLNSTLVINNSLTVIGFPEATMLSLSGGFTVRILDINSGVSLKLKYLNLTRGAGVNEGSAILNAGTVRLDSCKLFGNQSYTSGGAIFNDYNGVVHLNYCEFNNNKSMRFDPGTFAGGGALTSRGDSVIINNSGFYQNEVVGPQAVGPSSTILTRGGAIYNAAGYMLVQNTTISGNQVHNDFGMNSTDDAFGGGICNLSVLKLIGCTIYGNITNCSSSTLARGGGLYNLAIAHIKNTIFTENSALFGEQVYTRTGQITVSRGHNIFKDSTTTGMVYLSTDLTGDPMLNALGYVNGGFSQTHSFNCSSIAKDAGKDTLNLAYDQLGQARVSGVMTDIGAFELPPVNDTIDVAECSLYSGITGNDVWTVSGIYEDTIMHQGGCDTAFTINLTIELPILITVQDLEICEGDSTEINVSTSASSVTYSWNQGLSGDSLHSVSPTSSTTYVVMLNDISTGCSNSDSLAVVVNALPTIPIITKVGDGLQTTLFTSYQWFEDGILLAGDTNQQYTPDQNGDYSVEVTDVKGCSNSSSPFNYLSLGLDESNDELALTIYPNPTSDHLSFMNFNNQFHHVAIYSADGRVVSDFVMKSGFNVIDVSSMIKGIYYLRFMSSSSKYEDVIRQVAVY